MQADAFNSHVANFEEITETELYALAPTVMVNHRARRYHGDDLAISMEEFVAEDQETMRELYGILVGFFAALQGHGEERERTALAFMDGLDLAGLFVQVRELGAESYRASPSPLMAKTLHDVRGGGLAPLLGRLDLHRLRPKAPVAIETLYLLTRDHLKIMRNALLGLDDAQRDEDLKIKPHGTEFIVEKWDQAWASAEGQEAGAVRVEVTCLQNVEIAECCVEFGALDRILYNLMNNASRHTKGGVIRMMLFPTPDVHGENLRFVLINEVSPEDRAYLEGRDLQTLFKAGVSTTGSGYGLNVAAEFVSNAFGLKTPEAAAAGGYLGARLLHGQFVIWFHWPIIAEV